MQTPLVIASFIVNVISQSCEWGNFYEDNTNTCLFDCEADGYYIPLDTVPFDIIKDKCPRIAYANYLYPDDCNSTSDLFYGSCNCPYCKCTNPNTFDLGERLAYGTSTFLPPVGPTATCVNCTCTDTLLSHLSETVYDCNLLLQADDPRELEEYSCPPNTCTDTTWWGETVDFTAGDYWWSDNGNSSKLCTEFCYCTGNGGSICETGYENILNDDKLLGAFKADCHLYNSGLPAVKYTHIKYTTCDNIFAQKSVWMILYTVL